MHFGFSYVGFIFLILLFLPNLIWNRYKPVDYERYAAGEPPVLVWLERVGQGAATVFSLIFINFRPFPLWSFWLAGGFLLLALYEIWWIRYFRGPKTMADFYSDFLGIPVAGATLPVAAFFLLAVYGRNLLLGLATVMLGVGHIGIHLGHRREIAAQPQRQKQ